MPAAHNKESEDLEYWQEKLPQPSRQQNGSAHCKPDNDATRPAGKSKTLKKTPKQKSGKQASKQPGPAQPSPRQPGSGVASERTQWLPFIRKYLYRRSVHSGLHTSSLVHHRAYLLAHSKACRSLGSDQSPHWHITAYSEQQTNNETTERVSRCFMFFSSVRSARRWRLAGERKYRKDHASRCLLFSAIFLFLLHCWEFAYPFARVCVLQENSTEVELERSARCHPA